MYESKIFNTELGTECVTIPTLHAPQNQRTSIISPKRTFPMLLCVVLIIFLSHSCLNLMFRWNFDPNIVSSIVVKKQNCVRSLLAVESKRRCVALHFVILFQRSQYCVSKLHLCHPGMMWISVLQRFISISVHVYHLLFIVLNEL